MAGYSDSPDDDGVRRQHFMGFVRALLSHDSCYSSPHGNLAASVFVELTSLSMKDKSSSSRVEARCPFVTRTLSLVGARNVGGGGGSMGRAPSTIM